MLVLTRERDERIAFVCRGEVVGYLQVTDIRGDKVRLGIALDASVKVLREELLPPDQRDQLDAVVRASQQDPDERAAERRAGMAKPTQAERRGHHRPPGRGARANG